MDNDNEKPYQPKNFSRWDDLKDEPFKRNSYTDQAIPIGAVPMEPQTPLLDPFLNCGDQGAICGPEGAGKTQLAILFGALISNPELKANFLEGKNNLTADQTGLVVFFGTEDPIGRVHIPRAQSAGASQQSFHVVSQGSTNNITLIKILMPLRCVKLVILDHWSLISRGYGVGKLAFEKGLNDLLHFAQKNNIALIIIGHYTKSALRTSSPVDRSDYPKSLRTKFRKSFYCEPYSVDPNTGDRIFAFISVKTSHTGEFPGFLYRIVPAIVKDGDEEFKTSRIELIRLLTITEVLELTSLSAKLPIKNASLLDQAKDFLLESLASGPRLLSELLSLAASRGISKSTLDRAGNALSISSKRELGKHGHGRYLWSLTADSSENVPMDEGR